LRHKENVSMKSNIYKTSHLLILGLAIFWIAGSGCTKQKADMPAWIEVDSLSFDPVGTSLTSSSKFTDVWLYVNDNLVGGFELPARIPVLSEGNTDIILFPGIQVNGLTALRSPYLKIKRFEQSIHLVPGETIHLNPEFKIDSLLLANQGGFKFNEKFQGNGSSMALSTGAYGEFVTYNSPDAFEGGKCGLLKHNGAENTITQVENNEWITLPKGDVGGIFFEMNYKCNTSFTVSLLAKPDDGGSVQKIGVIGINESADWNKIYITLSNSVGSFTAGNQFKLAISYARQPAIATQEVYLDNLQIYY
jgi:hypothetical protein